MRRRVFIAIPVAAWFGILCLFAYYLWNTRYVVSVGVPTSLNRYDDDEPVTTTLHEYSSSSYETTGKSISLSFARGLYTFASNARGGPQYYIGISVDRSTLSRVNTQRQQEWVKLNPPYAINSNAYILNSSPSNLDIWVYSSKASGGSHRLIERALDKDPIDPFASFCGVTWYLKQDISPSVLDRNQVVPSNAPGPDFGTGAGVLGVLEGVETAGKPATAFCNAGGGDCEIYATFENWEVRFAIQRPRLCNWPAELTRVRKFLDSHVIARTQRRDP